MSLVVLFIPKLQTSTLSRVCLCCFPPLHSSRQGWDKHRAFEQDEFPSIWSKNSELFDLFEPNQDIRVADHVLMMSIRRRVWNVFFKVCFYSPSSPRFDTRQKRTIPNRNQSSSRPPGSHPPWWFFYSKNNGAWDVKLVDVCDTVTAEW